MSSEVKFNPSRLEFARKRRGITKKNICDQLGITTRAYGNYEKGEREPQEKTIELLSSILKFPTHFFYRDNPVPLDPSQVSFRSFSRMPANVRDKALHAGQIALEFSKWLDCQFELPMPDLPDLSEYDHKPELAADILRKEWGIGVRPIKNIVHLLEAKGIRVFSLEESTKDLDAYSFWEDGVPFVFLNTRTSAERSRFDASHELGHLVLHNHLDSRGKEAEIAANRFASAFLMPKESIVAYASKFITLTWIISVKSFWRVSASALVRRLSDLGIITEWQYRTLVIELSRRGYTKKEPNPIGNRDSSKLFPMIFQALHKEKTTKKVIASELGVYVEELNSLLFNLTLTEVHTERRNSNFLLENNEKISYLRLVK